MIAAATLRLIFPFLLGASVAHAGLFGFGKDPAPLVAKGYDVVSYHQEDGPVEGDRKHAIVYQGRTYRFANAENLETFSRRPDRYAPAYGGYCAYGVAKGGRYSIDPHAYSIVEGRLYLNYDQKVRAMWTKDRERYIREADENWPGLK